MKDLTVLSATFALFLSSCVVAQKDSKFPKSEREFSFEQTYKVIEPVQLAVSTSGGNIRAVGYGGNQVEVKFIVEKNGQVLNMTLEELKKVAQVAINSNSSSLEIAVEKISERDLCVGFEIRTPQKTSTDLSTSGGNVVVERLEAAQKIHTSGGNVAAENIHGEVKASTSGGNVVLNNLTGKASAYTSGGNIVASNVKGAVDAHTSGGNIVVDKVSGRVKAETSGGNVVANMDQVSEGLELRTSGGGVVCTIPKTLGANLDIKGSHSGDVINFDGYNSDDRMEGKMNGGGVPVVLETSGGVITLNYK